MKKIIKIGAIVFVVLVLVCVAAYFYFFGFGKKGKYEKCVKTCKDMILLESNKSACEARCSEIAGYQPEKTKEETPKKATGAVKKSDEAAIEETITKKKQEKPSEDKKYIDNQTAWEDRQYYCEWVWPQEIIDKNSGEPIFVCPRERPWCDYGKEYKYEEVGCCKNYDEGTKEKTDCITLPELLKNR